MGEGGGFRFDSGYRFLAILLKICLSGANYRRASQLLLTRIVDSGGLGPTGLGCWVGWVLYMFYWESTLVDQLFQPSQNPVEMVENNAYWLLSQSWALIHYVMSVISRSCHLVNTVGVWCPLSPGTRPCFQLFQPKTVEMRSTGTLQPHQPKMV